MVTRNCFANQSYEQKLVTELVDEEFEYEGSELQIQKMKEILNEKI